VARLCVCVLSWCGFKMGVFWLCWFRFVVLCSDRCVCFEVLTVCCVVFWGECISLCRWCWVGMHIAFVSVACIRATAVVLCCAVLCQISSSWCVWAVWGVRVCLV